MTATDGHDANEIGLMSLPINMTGAKKRVTVESGWRAEDNCLKWLSSGVRPVVATFIIVGKAHRHSPYCCSPRAV